MDQFNDSLPTTVVIWRRMIWEKTRFDRVEMAVASLNVRPWHVSVGAEEDGVTPQCCWYPADIGTV
jgi:hypothetical protein